MSDYVRITDVSPRDGLQNEPGFVATADKARLVELLVAAGVDEVEVTSFVSPKWVPQLADAAEVLALLPLPEGGGGGVGAERPAHATNTRPPRSDVSVARASELRRAATSSEKALWGVLRGRNIHGLKFRRQHPFGPYILDFFCHEMGLAIEIDGRSHDRERYEYDWRRQEWIESQGVRVVRVSHEEVLRNREGVAQGIADIAGSMSRTAQRQPTSQPPPSGRGGRKLSVLVPNEMGLKRALEANRRAGGTLITKVSVFTAASEAFSKRNTNATIAEAIERFRPVVNEAQEFGLTVRGYISCVIACPFEGPIAPGRVAEVAAQLVGLGVDEIDLGDTIGAGTTETTTAMLAAVAETVPDDVDTTLHLHDTFGRAAECVRAALEAGVRSFDGSVAGLGGCPYVGGKAPGNISTELLVRSVHAAGFVTGVDLDALEKAAAFARAIVARARPGGGE